MTASRAPLFVPWSPWDETRAALDERAAGGEPAWGRPLAGLALVTLAVVLVYVSVRRSGP